MITKQSRKVEWVLKNGGASALEFLEPQLKKMYEESKMLEKQEAEAKAEVEPNAEAKADAEVKTDVAETPAVEPALEKTVEKDAAADFVELADFEEITTSLIGAIEKQREEIAMLTKSVSELQEALADTIEKQDKIEDAQLPAATAASLVKSRLYERLNSFGTPLLETNELVKSAPKEKVIEPKQEYTHALNGLVEGF